MLGPEENVCKRECTSRREGPEGQGWRVCFRSRSASWMLHGTLGRSGHVICHVSPLLRTLHWFPTSLEVNAKVLARPYKIGLRNHTYRIAMSMYTHTHTCTHYPLDALPPITTPTICFSTLQSYPCSQNTPSSCPSQVSSFNVLYASLSSLPGLFSSVALVTFRHTVRPACVFVHVRLSSLGFKQEASWFCSLWSSQHFR